MWCLRSSLFLTVVFVSFFPIGWLVVLRFKAFESIREYKRRERERERKNAFAMMMQNNGGTCCFSLKRSALSSGNSSANNTALHFCRVRQNHHHHHHPPTRRRTLRRTLRASSSSSVPPPEYARNVHAEEVQRNENECVLNTYGRGKSRVITHGKGVLCFDSEGNEYLDFTAGIAVNCLGHADEKLAKVIAEQAKTLLHTSNLYHTEPQASLAKKLVETSFAERAFFCNSGTEANEACVKFARKYHYEKFRKMSRSDQEFYKKPATETVSFKNGFHGRTMGALALTWKEQYRKPFEPLMPGNAFATYGDLKSAAKVIKRGKTAVVFVEPAQGEGGIFPADAEFLKGLRKLCDENDCLLAYDEVQCGLGRTGYLWAHQKIGKECEPDLLSAAKPLANGLPIGCVLMKQKVADAMQPGDHGSTFAGGPLVCRAALHVFDRVQEPGFLDNVKTNGEYLKDTLAEGLKGHPMFKEVRGTGLLVGVQFTDMAAPLVKACGENGLLVITAGKGDVLRLVPPLVVTKEQIDKAVEIICEQALKVMV